MSIIPDNKNWTWVLEHPCPECAFDASRITGLEVAGMVRDNAGAWNAILSSRLNPRLRPRADTWSPLEYACHARDVMRLGHLRVSLMANEDVPVFANWDQNATAIADRYDLAEPEVVAVEIDDAAMMLSRLLDSIAPQAWSRTGMRSDGSGFSIDSFARYLVHDLVHHIYDVS